ncbi:MAG: glycine betaine ABC transporter substrate-binding protein [Hyphomicrobiaceae bacterium]
MLVRIGIIGVVTMILAIGNRAEAARCGDVQITEMNWVSAKLVTAIAATIMARGYGCTVTKVRTSTVPAIADVGATGKPDVITELWVKSAPDFSRLEMAGKVTTLADVFSNGGVEAWWIPNYLARAHPELRSIKGILKNPDLVKGVFHNCPSGWACRVINDNMALAFNFDAHGLRIVNHDSDASLAESLASAFEARRPWFGYYWSPTPLLGKYPMVKVDVGPYNAKAHACNASRTCKSPAPSAYPRSRVVTAATTSFVALYPSVAEFLRRMVFTNNQMGKLLAWAESEKATAEEAVQNFLKTNRGVWPEWLDDEARDSMLATLN